MGIKNLAKVIKTHAPSALKQHQMKYYSGYKVAVDASMCIYQFLVSVRAEGSNLAYGDETTSHLSGLFYRCIRWVQEGIIPIFVFDGEAPAAKVHELTKRDKRRENVQEKLKQAIKDNDALSVTKYEKISVKMTKEHISDCMHLLELLCIPFITAPSEAEAYCAYLNKTNYVDAVATEDMDTLCFGANVLLRNFNASKSKNLAIDEYNLNAALKELNLTMEEFIDMCIMLGCDYSGTIKGIGPKKAVDFIFKYKNIDNMLKKEEIETGEDFKYEEARDIFLNLSGNEFNENFVCENKSKENENKIKIFISRTNIENLKKISFEPNNIDEQAVINYLVNEKGFDKQRIENGIKKLKGCKIEGKQTRIESFFTKK
ncbi:FEN1 [Ecytonucleospora hepatopenaei]|uniref:Flap endonuclease 1 n=1 Tax=Ecytonucleospora hepatopenaei TaxID=646526 RepID=A0A1W0E8Z9_9MICR|nr:FEN1 [Ecytonucleospora hepatopenaei]